MKNVLFVAAFACAPLFGDFCEQCYEDQLTGPWAELQQCQFYDLLDSIRDSWEEDDLQQTNLSIGLLIILVNDGNDE